MVWAVMCSRTATELFFSNRISLSNKSHNFLVIGRHTRLGVLVSQCNYPTQREASFVAVGKDVPLEGYSSVARQLMESLDLPGVDPIPIASAQLSNC